MGEAGRLQDSAEPGAVAVSADTRYRRIQTKPVVMKRGGRVARHERSERDGNELFTSQISVLRFPVTRSFLYSRKPGDRQMPEEEKRLP